MKALLLTLSLPLFLVSLEADAAGLRPARRGVVGEVAVRIETARRYSSMNMLRVSRLMRPAARTALMKDGPVGDRQVKALIAIGNTLETMKTKVPGTRKRIGLPRRLQRGFASYIHQMVKAGYDPGVESTYWSQTWSAEGKSNVQIYGKGMSTVFEGILVKVGEPRVKLQLNPREDDAVYNFLPDSAWVLDAEGFGDKIDLAWADVIDSSGDLKKRIGMATPIQTRLSSVGPRYEVHFNVAGDVIQVWKLR